MQLMLFYCDNGEFIPELKNKWEGENVGGTLSLMKQLDGSHALIVSVKLCAGRIREGRKIRRRRDWCWRSTSETCCDCSYNARLTHLEMHESEGAELHSALSHSDGAALYV